MILTKEKINSVDLNFLRDLKTSAGRLNELLLIVPTNRKSRYLKKELIDSSPNNASEEINIETIGTFSSKILFGESDFKNKILSEAASAVLLKQSFNEVKLQYFHLYKGDVPAGTLERVKNVISEYKKHGIFPDKLFVEAIKLAGSEQNKALDIASVYDIYLKKCAKLRVKEIGDINSEVRNFTEDNFKKNFRELFPAVDLIIVNGFDEFTFPEIEIIDKLSHAENCKLFISFDYYKKNPLLFSHLDKCYLNFQSKGFKQIVDKSTDPYEHFRDAVRKKLFLYGANEREKEFEKNIIKISAKNPETEIELIAKQIKLLITEENVKPNEICVSFNLISKYSPLVRDIFNLYGIPFNLTDRFALSNSQPVITIINFLEILENDFYYKNIFRALSGGFLHIKDVHLADLLKASVDLKIISGYRNWLNSIEDAVSKLDDEEEESVRDEINKSSYFRAKKSLEIIEELLSPFDKKITAKEFKEKFISLIYRLDLPTRLLNSPGERVEENVKALTVFVDIVEEMLELFNLEFGEEKKFDLKEFLTNIRTAAASSRYNIKERSGYGVLVTTMNEIRGIRFDNLFLAGMIDGDMPTRYQPEIFYSYNYLKEKERQHQTEERYQFYQALCCWNKKLFFTLPRQDSRSELVESNFLTEFEELFPIIIKNEKDFEHAVFSKEDLLKISGEYGTEEFEKAYNVLSKEKLSEISKALNVDKIRRENPYGKNKFTGYIFNDLNEISAEALRRFSDREYSITQLEMYAKCPYKYFAERILYLTPLEEPSEEIEALEMGSLLHNILYEFYTKISEENIRLENCSIETFQKAEDILFSIAGDKIDEANFNSPLSFYEKEKILGINGDRKNSILHKFLIDEREKLEGFVPEFFEKGFGNITGISSGIFLAGDVKIRGKIDRIEINEDEKKYKVVDYKLSKTRPTQEDLDTGISLQLPLYMYAAKELIKSELFDDYFPDKAEIYSLKFSKDDFGKFALPGQNKNVDAYNENLIKDCLKFIQKYAEGIKEGRFRLSDLKNRENKVCRFCSFKVICRIDEVD